VDNKIFLIHQTTKEYLVRTKEVQTLHAESWKHCLDPEDSNSILAWICVAYLLFVDFERSPLVPKDSKVHGYAAKYYFLDYAAKCWAGHFHVLKR
jgi:hypothetical protein